MATAARSQPRRDRNDSDGTHDPEAGAPAAPPASAAAPHNENGGSYVVPLVHAHLPARGVELGFWGGLAGAALLGAIDPPLALAVGAGVLIARHHNR